MVCWNGVQELTSQLDALKGIEKHALTVLQRYLEPAHQARLEQARLAIQVFS